MNDRVAPERLQPNQFALGKNIETRYGGVRSRRGSWRVDGSLTDNNSDEMTVVGSGIHKYTEVGKSDLILTAMYREDDDQTVIYRSAFPVKDYRRALELPKTLQGSVPVRFAQAYGYTYAFPDGGTPIRWSGDFNDDFEYVPNGVSGAMPEARDGVYAYNRLWLIEGDDTIIASDLLDANWDRINNEFRVEQGDGTRLVALRPFSNGNLIAFKERGIAVITGANNFVTTADMTMQFIDDRIGCVAPDTAVPIGKDVFFLGREGVWTIQQTSEQNAQLVELPLSEPIWGLIQDINWQYAENFSATHHDNYYILAVSVEGSEYPNRLLVYDLLSRSWVGYWEHGGTPKTFQRVGVVDHLGKQFMLGLESNGSTNVMLRGDTKDLLESTKSFMDGGITEFETYFSGTAYPNGTDGFDLSEHTDGRIDMVVRFDPTGSLTFTYNQFFGPPFGTGASRYVQGYWTVDGNYDMTSLGFRHLAPSTKWDGVVDGVPNLVDGAFHNISLVHDGVEPWCEIDGEVYRFRFVNETDKTAWLDTIWNNLGFCYNSVTGAANTLKTCDLAYVSISTEYKTAAPHTTEISRWVAPMLPGEEGKAYYWIDDTIREVSYPVDGAGYNAYLQANASAEYDTYSGSATDDITSELKTRGYTHGGELIQKSAYRGEVRFEHGQPSVTATMNSDKPFDTETLASLNAKTYSLTDYDIHGKTAWVQDNSNDDFATPFREDYAPIALNGAGSGVDIGTNGLDLDVYAEHTELFSSLAVAGWVQFTLTNTQGYVRYNNLKIQADNRELQQDGGNQ